MTKLFVGGIPYKMTQDELQQLFVPFGQIASVAVITDKFTGQSKGFAFVEMPNDEEAQAAINGLNDTMVEDRKIHVSVARPKEDRPRNDFRGPGGGGGFQRRDDGFRRDDRGGRRGGR